jgi:hypothetical protein
LKPDSKIHLAGISAIIITVVVSFWGFGLADKVFEFDSVVQEMKEGIRNSEIKQIEEEILVEDTEDQSQQIEEQTVEQDVIFEGTISSTKETNTESEFETGYYQNEQDNEREKALLLEDKIESLEENLFQLSGSGTGWEGTRSNSVRVMLELKLEPINETDLTEFKIMDGKLSFPEVTFYLEGGKAKIEKNNFLIENKHDEATDPYLNITGKISGSVLDDDTITVNFVDQMLYLVEGDKTPINLDLKTTLSH